MFNNVNILGSCVTRDIFTHVEQQNYKVDYYHARSSILSLMSFPYITEESEINLESSFKRRVVQTDLNKDYFKKLEKYKENILLIDFIDERFALYQIGRTLVTRSSYFVEAGLMERFGGRLVRKSDVIDEWEDACGRFVNELTKLYSPNDVVLHKAFFSYDYLNTKGEKVSFDDRRVKIYTSINKLLDHYYNYVEKLLPEMKIIELPRGSYTASENHKWGLAPMHYEDSYYKRIYRELDKKINSKTVLV